MKVHELIAILEDCCPDHEVIMQRDSEGNGFSPLYACFSNLDYEVETPYSGNVPHKDDIDPDVNYTKCVLLTPGN